ncbi:MAG: caspase family protein [Magnetococcus sp. YQC-5]
MNTTVKYMLLWTFLLFVPWPVEQSIAGPAFMRSSGASSLNTAIRMNTRQIFKPTFTIQSRHSGAMNAIGLSSDGKWLASASSNASAQLWNLTTGQRELDLRGHSGPVLAVAFVPGGLTYGYQAKPTTKQAAARKGFLVTGGADGEVRLWSQITGETVRRFRGHTKAVTSMATTPDGLYLLTGSEDHTAKLWKLDDGTLVRTFQGHQDAIKTLGVTPNGQQLATGSTDGSIRIWNVNSGAMQEELSGSDGDVLTLAWSPNGKLLASGHKNGTLRLHPTAKGADDLVITGDTGAIHGLAFRPDSALIATVGADQQVHLWSLPDGKPLKPLAGHQKEINTVAFGDNGRLLLTGSTDQTVRFWRLDPGEEIARLVSMQSGWAVVTPDGRFDGTLDGAMEDRLDAIQWTGDGLAFAVDGFLEKYYQPALLGKILARRATPDVTVPNVTEGFQLPPRIIEVVSPNGSASQKQVEIKISAEDMGGGITEVRLFQNSKIIDKAKATSEGTSEGKNGTVEKIKYQVELVNGTNVFQVVGLSKDRIEGENASLTLKHQAPMDEPPPQLHVFVVGVNQYANKDLTLDFAVPDAKGILDYFLKNYVKTFKNATTYTLYDQKATRNLINTAMTDLNKIEPKDTVILYFAGHGETLAKDETWYFIPQDLPGTEENQIQTHAVSSQIIKEHVSKIGAHNVVLLIDACKSGKMMDAFGEFANQKSMATLSRSTGIHIATATTGSQLANELQTLGHGVFTYALLEGLSGKADTDPKDGVVSIKEILSFTKQYMPILSKKYELDAQTPVINSRGENFVIAKTSGK